MIVLFSIFLSACGEEEVKTFDFTVDEYEVKLKNEIGSSGKGSFIKMKDKQLLDDGKYGIALTDQIFVYIQPGKDDKVTDARVAFKSNAFLVQNKEVKIAFFALLRTIDESLSLTQQYAIFDELGMSDDSKMMDHTGVYALNDVEYTYVGSVEEDTLMLKAEPK